MSNDVRFSFKACSIMVEQSSFVTMFFKASWRMATLSRSLYDMEDVRKNVLAHYFDADIDSPFRFAYESHSHVSRTLLSSMGLGNHVRWY